MIWVSCFKFLWILPFVLLIVFLHHISSFYSRLLIWIIPDVPWQSILKCTRSVVHSWCFTVYIVCFLCILLSFEPNVNLIINLYSTWTNNEILNEWLQIQICLSFDFIHSYHNRASKMLNNNNYSETPDIRDCAALKIF